MGVGSVTECSARIWFRSERPGNLQLELWAESEREAERSWPVPVRWERARDGTGAFTYPDDFEGGTALSPESRYRFRITRGEGRGEPALLGGGRFETAPRRGSQRSIFSFALMSCNQPFLPDGTVAPRAAALLTRLEPALQRHRVKYSLLMGDQIYADGPTEASLFAPGGPLQDHPSVVLPPEQIRAAYQRRYRQFWNTPLALSWAERPSYVCLDDHDVFDNWGSALEHASEPWRQVSAAALDVAFDYQLLRNLPEQRRRGPYHHTFRWGPTATFVADIRSERRAGGPSPTLMPAAQLAALESFLEQNDDCGVLFIVFSVPLAFLPSWFLQAGVAITGSDAGMDAWAWQGWKRDRDRVLELLVSQRQRRPTQQLVLLSGDIHESLAVALEVMPGALPLYQFVSSPVTNTERDLLQWLAHRGSEWTGAVEFGRSRLPVALLSGVPPADANPSAELNVGIVDVDASRDAANVRYRVLSPSAGGDLEVVFDSGTLEPRA